MDGTKTRNNQDAAKWSSETPTLSHTTEARKDGAPNILRLRMRVQTERMGHPPRGGPLVASPSLYDAAGNMWTDGANLYLYDADGHVCAVQDTDPYNPSLTGYLYNASGQRVAKGKINSLSCDPSSNGFGTMTNPYTQYILGPNGEQMTEIAYSGGTSTPVHTNVVAGGVIATYVPNDTASPHFRLTDWLGTTRAQTDNSGTLELTCQSLPFGDDPSMTQCTPTAPVTEQFFTGKERDAESGNDYFGARYYGSSMGRFMSPDPGWYLQADVQNPQSWNQYSYVLNNPLINTDPDGRECVWDDGSFDSADDKQTGNAEGCSSQGGTYVNPDLFENALLTNGQNANYQRGDWSADANSTLQQSWVDPSATITGSPMQNGNFTSNMSMNDFISMMQQSNFYLSDMDQALADHHLSAHNGIQMRQDKEGCNLHVNIDRNSGQDGKPVTGDFHYDVLNPNPNTKPTDSVITAPLHGAEAAIDIGMTRAGISGTVGDRVCPSR
jgi:RHS repeat-associated protein